MNLTDFIRIGASLAGSFLNQEEHLTPVHSPFLKWLGIERRHMIDFSRDYQPAMRHDVRVSLVAHYALSPMPNHAVGVWVRGDRYEIFGIQKDMPGDLERMLRVPLPPPPLTLMGLDGKPEPHPVEDNRPRPKVGISDANGFETCHVAIQKPLADEIVAAWAKVFERSRILPIQLEGLDGVDYLFSLKTNGKTRDGYIWSPLEGSPPAMLAAIGETMWDICTRQKPTLLPQLDRQVRNFLKSN